MSLRCPTSSSKSAKGTGTQWDRLMWSAPEDEMHISMEGGAGACRAPQPENI